MKRRFIIALVVIAAAIVSAVAAATSYGGKTQPNHKAAGTIEVLSLWGGSEKDAFIKVTDAFTKKTGIKVNYTTARDFVPAIRTRLAAGNPPEVAIVPRPGVLADFARQGAVKDLGKMGLSKSYISARYGPAWIKLGTVDGKLYGVAAKANSKSVVWYRPDQFKKYKLTPSKSWTQMVQLTKKLKSKGQVPWSLGAKDSWTLTDWFENIYVRTAGPQKYTQLFTGKLPFTDSSVSVALKDMGQILNNKYVYGGVQGALGTAFTDGIGQVFSTKPKAQLYMEGGFVGGIATQQVNTKLKPGKTINSFPFPTIKKQYGSPMVGGGDLAAAFTDNADVRAFLKYISSAEAGRVWVSTGAIISPNKQVKAGAYPNLLVRAEAKQVTTAKTFVFDGSDLLPGTLGDDWGSTLQGVLQKPGNTKKLLSDFQSKAQKQF
ncbi:MAG: alpha-glucoside transport system substrate-binding protein [Gaiellaceae bacterium]|nr:alpha-glucoside transport system substrate-binding protein [Gaiellaceae bacterium]